jgi:hypothetical protein
MTDIDMELQTSKYQREFSPNFELQYQVLWAHMQPVNNQETSARLSTPIFRGK